MLIAVTTAHRAATAALEAEGVLPATAAAVVGHMITADLWGRRSHGLSVRFGAALAKARQGGGRRRPEIVADGGATVAVDDHDGFGTAAGRFAADLLVERVGLHGLAAVAVRHTGHTGMLGDFADRGARRGVVTLAFTHCRPMVIPTGGARALFGSNPLAFGLPAEPDPVLVDLSTAAVTYGQLLVHEREGRPLPEGVAVDAEGRPTTEAAAARRGALRPWGGHRGSALSAAIQLLAGALTGAAVFPEGGRGYGLLLVGVARGAFVDDAAYDAALAEFAAGVAACPPAPGEGARLPGSRRYESARRAGGRIEVDDDLASLLGLDRPDPASR